MCTNEIEYATISTFMYPRCERARLSGYTATHWLRVRCAGVEPGFPWHLLQCCGSSCVVLASRFCGTRWPLWLGTCPRAVVVPAACLSGVPRGPGLVRRASSVPVALRAVVGFPVAVVPPALLAGCAGHVEAGREPGSLCLPLAPAEARALGALRVIPVRGPAMGLSLAGFSGFGLGLRALRWFGVCGPGH